MRTGRLLALRAAGWLPLLVCGLPLAGCTPAARVSLLSVEPKHLARRGPLIQHFELTEGYFWHDGQGQLWLAFSESNLAPETSVGRESFEMSLVLEEAPAGEGRDYAAKRRTLRAMIADHGRWTRYGSYYGVVTVWFEDYTKDVLCGRFQIWANQQEYKFWRDHWGSDRKVLFVGEEFTAVRDATRGEEIRQRTEIDELKRAPYQPVPRRVTGPPVETRPDERG